MNMAEATFLLPWLVLIPCLAIWGYSLVDFSETDERDMRTFSRPIWLVLLVFGSVVGGSAWLVAGRPRPPSVRRRTWFGGDMASAARSASSRFPAN